jgi:hypothetical protein
MYEWMMFVDAMMGLLIPILVIVAIKVSVPFAGKLKLVDSPNSRKLHACDVAVVGGLGMFLGVAVGLMSGEYSYDGLVLFAFLRLSTDFNKEIRYKLVNDYDNPTKASGGLRACLMMLHCRACFSFVTHAKFAIYVISYVLYLHF